MVTGGGQGAGAGSDFLGAALHSPREATLVLSNRGLTLSGGPVPFFLFRWLCCCSCSSGGVALRCVISARR